MMVSVAEVAAAVNEVHGSLLASDISLALRAIENQAYDNDRHRAFAEPVILYLTGPQR